MRTGNSLSNRFIALLLCMIMVLGMVPTGVIAADDESQYATVTSLSTDNVAINGSGKEIHAVVTGTLDWIPKDESVGRTEDGWWAGIQVTAPETADLTNAYYLSGGNKVFFKDVEDSAEEHYVQIWRRTQASWLRDANLTDGLSTYTLEFNWDGDEEGTIEQTVYIDFDADQLVLNGEDQNPVYPAPLLGYGKLDMLTTGAVISDNESSNITISYQEPVTVAWVGADTSIGRYQDGWWAGMKITVPAGMTVEQLKAAQYMSGENRRDFWSYKDSKEDDQVHYMTMWIPLNKLLTNSMNPYTYQFDWNNDGLFEQSVVMTVDASKITLTKDDVQVYPVLGQVTSFHGGTVNGSGTGKVDVLIDTVNLDWSEADNEDRTKAWWVGVKVEAPVGMDAQILKDAKILVRRDESIDWENAESVSFWSSKDSADNAEFHHVGLWLPLSPAAVEEAKAAGKIITRWYRFDWDNDGVYDQEITFRVDPTGSITLNKVKQTVTFETESPVDIWVGKGSYKNVATCDQSGHTVSYTVQEGPATVDENGVVTFNGVGTVVVVASCAGDDFYEPASASYTITAVKNNWEPFSFETSNPVITYQAEPNNSFTNVLNGQDENVTYAIVSVDGDVQTLVNATEVAKIDTKTGELTILQAGVVTVRATKPATEQYKETTAEYTLTVNPADQVISFKSEVTTLTYTPEALPLPEIEGKLSSADIQYSIDEESQVAKIVDGKLQLLKAGSFVMEIVVPGDAKYNASNTLKWQVTVEKAEQTNFSFKLEEDTITYNDKDKNVVDGQENKYTLITSGAEETDGKVTYTVIEGDAATADGNVLTIHKAGTVTVQAIKAGNDQYKDATCKLVLTINKAKQSFTFDHETEVVKPYGLINFATEMTASEKNSGRIEYSLVDNTLGATIDNAGVVSFVDGKIGKVTVNVKMVEDACYEPFDASYTIELAYQDTPEVPYTLVGDKLIEDGAWFTGDVQICAPEGYEISFKNTLTDNDWNESVTWTVDGEDGKWDENNKPIVYLKHKDGGITDAIYAKDLKKDIQKPNKLSISYSTSFFANAFDKLFFLNATTVTVTAGAEDDMSDIAKMEYSLNEGESYQEITPNADGKYVFEVNPVERTQLYIRATDKAGNSEVFADVDVDPNNQYADGTAKVLVVDNTNPNVTAKFEGGMDDTATDGIRYVKGEEITVTLTFDDENLDLAAAAPKVTVNDANVPNKYFNADRSTCILPLKKEGVHVIKAQFTDGLGREAAYTTEIHIDRQAPVLESTLDEGKYYIEDQNMVLTITEANFDATKVELDVQARNSTGGAVALADEMKEAIEKANKPEGWASNKDNPGVYTLNLPVTVDANYTVTLKCTDMLGWPSEHVKQFTVDKMNPTAPSITLDAVKEETIDGTDYGFSYNDVTVTILTEDAVSGVDYVALKLTPMEPETATTLVMPENLLVNTDGSVKSGSMGFIEKINSSTVDGELALSFNLPAQFRGTIEATVYDKATRNSTATAGKEVVVDRVAPDVSIFFEGDRQAAVEKDVGDNHNRADVAVSNADTRFIYNGNVSATVKVKEANFFSDMTIRITCDGAEVEDYEAAEIDDSGWSFADGYFSRTFVMTADGDYRLFVVYKDHSGNDMEWVGGEFKDQKGTYQYESNIHTIDTTAPEYKVTYEPAAEYIQVVDGREYYDAPRKAIIQITDRNFRPSEVVFNVIAENTLAEELLTVPDLTMWKNWQRTGDTWTAEMDFNANANYMVALSYTDLANHKMVNSEKVQEDYSVAFTVDTKDPTDLNVEYKSKDESLANQIVGMITFGNRDAGQEVVLTMHDATAAIDYIDLIITPEGPECATDLQMPNALQVNADGSVKFGDKGFIDEIRSSIVDGKVTLSFDVPAQFRGNVSFVAHDRSGNQTSFGENPNALVVDTIAPGQTITYNPSNVVNVSDMKDMTGFAADQGIVDKAGKQDEYVMYFSTDAVAKIQIAEANFDPTQVEIAVLDANDNPVDNWTMTEWTTTTQAGQADVHTTTVTIPDEGDYRIRVKYQDYSLNEAVDYLSQWIVVDKTNPEIKVEYQNTNALNVIDERAYFDDVQTAVITITEHNFRADDVRIHVTAKDVGGISLNANEDGTVDAYTAQGTNPAQWSGFNSGSWRRDDDKFVITLVFDTNANYTFDIDYQDLAKRNADDYQADLFTVDNTPPENLTVQYSQKISDQFLDAILFDYYNSMMTVTITAEDDISGVYHFAYSYVKGANVSDVNKELLDQAIREAEIDFSGKKATAKFDIPKDVLTSENQFNGTVRFTAFNRSELSTEMKDDTNIVVDNIAPTATITYNTPVQNANGNSYYDGNINATIVINEANFYSNDVVVTVTKNGTNYPVNVSWRDNSVDTHTGTFTLTEDGDYIVSVQYVDRSTNEMTPYTSNKLVLDTVMPTIRVSNIKANSANKDETYGFEITIDDINLDASSMKPELKAVLQNENGVYETTDIDLGEAKTVVSGRTYTYTVENLPDDGLYTLVCVAKDMSANTMAQVVLDDEKAYDQVQFSINRTGSAFAYGNSFTEELVAQYYVYSVDEDVVFMEINVDPIENYKVTLNGKDLVEGTDFTSTQSSKSGEWSKRIYTIKKDLFAAEGEYNIVVSSTDKTETTAYSDVKNRNLEFVVDQTKPVLTITGLEAGGRYQTEAQTVTLIPTDEGGRLNSLSAVVLDSDGNPLKDEAGTDISVLFNMAGEELLKYLADNDGIITFTVPEGLNNQVRIICNDCAVNAEGKTNEYNELFEDVTVSQNQFVIFYANTPLFVGTIVGVVAVIGLTIFLIRRKVSKKNKTNA